MPVSQLSHLQTLVAVLEEGTFESAARRLRVTASAISQRIKAMEQDAGQVLVQRSNPVLPTAAGQLILRYAQQVQLLERDLDRGLSTGSASAQPASLAVAVNADSLATWFLPILSAAHQQLGAVFDVHREDQDYTAELLRAGTVMAAVTSEARPVQGCTSVRLGIMRYRALATPAFRDRWLPTGALVELDGAPLVDFDRRDDLQQGFLRRLLGHPPRSPRHFIPTSADFARAVLLGMGWGLMPDLQCAEDLASGDLVDLAPDRPIDVPLYWQRWNLQTPLLDDLTVLVVTGARAQLTPFPA